MNRWVALDPAYPPLAGEPLMAGSAAHHHHPAARRQRLQQRRTQPGERDLDIGMPVHGERLPRLVLERTHHRVGAGDQDEHLRLVPVQQAQRHRRVGRIRDLGADVGAGGGQLGKCRAGPGDRDHRSTSLGERASDPTPQAPAGANHDRGPARQVTHNRPRIAVGVVLVETPASPRSDRFFFHPTGVISGVEWNGTAARRRCPCRT